jgi:hypothetical protein
VDPRICKAESKGEEREVRFKRRKEGKVKQQRAGIKIGRLKS